MDQFKATLEIYPLPKADINNAIIQYLENEGISSYSVAGMLPELQKNRDSIVFPANLCQGNPEILLNQITKYFKPIYGLVNSLKKPLLINSGGGAFNEYFINLSNYARASFCVGLDSLDDFEKKRGIPKFRNCIWAIDEIGNNVTEKDQAIRNMAYGFSYLSLYFFKESEEVTLGFNNLMGFLNEASKYFALASQCSAFSAPAQALSEVAIAVASAKLSKYHEDLVQDEPNKGHFGQAIAYAKKCVNFTQRCLNSVVWDSLKGKAQNFSQVMQPKIADMEYRNSQIYKDQVPNENALYLPEVSSKVISQLNPYPDSETEFAEFMASIKDYKLSGYLQKVQSLLQQAQASASNAGAGTSTVQLHTFLIEKKELCRENLLRLKGLADSLHARGKNVSTQSEKLEKFQMKFFQADEIDTQANKQFDSWKSNSGATSNLDQNTKNEFLNFAQNYGKDAISERIAAGEGQGLKGAALDDFVLAPVTSKLNMIINSSSGSNEDLNSKFNNGLGFYEGLNQKLNEIQNELNAMM